MLLKVLLLLIFFGVMIGVGFYSRKKAGNVTDYVLGGREVGPWITAFAYGTSYFSSVVFVGYAGQFGWNPAQCPISLASASSPSLCRSPAA